MAQIKSITSEALEATVRNLLPSQQGFGEDLQAQNVIVPIIDLTPTAEGSQLREYLQRAISFTDNTYFSSRNSTDNLANSPGFWQIVGTAHTFVDATTDGVFSFQVNNGLAFNTLWQGFHRPQSPDTATAVPFDLIVFLDTGETLQASTSTNASLRGSYRQVADRYGNIVNPTGFTFE